MRSALPPMTLVDAHFASETMEVRHCRFLRVTDANSVERAWRSSLSIGIILEMAPGQEHVGNDPSLDGGHKGARE